MNGERRISDLQLAAFLVASGFQFVRLEGPGRRTFIFTGVPNATVSVDASNSGGIHVRRTILTLERRVQALTESLASVSADDHAPIVTQFQELRCALTIIVKAMETRAVEARNQS
jgi:hypothetical protein